MTMTEFTAEDPDTHRTSIDEEHEARLRATDPEVRRAAVADLAAAAPGDSGDSGDTFAWALADSDETVRRAAASALRDLPELYISEDGVQALLLATASSRDAEVRRTAADLLSQLTDGARDLYAQGLTDGEPHLRIQAVLGLATLQSVGALAEAADDPSRDVRVAVAEGLAHTCTAQARAVQALEQLITDHDPVVRMAALDAAAGLGLPEPLGERAAESIVHASWQVRRRAAQALGSGTSEVAIPPLVEALRDRIVDVRRAAVESLGRWAAESPEVITTLTESLNDPDPGVRTQARWALA